MIGAGSQFAFVAWDAVERISGASEADRFRVVVESITDRVGGLDPPVQFLELRAGQPGQPWTPS